MRTLISLTLSLSLLTGLFTKLSNWATANFRTAPEKVIIDAALSSSVFMAMDTLSIMDASLIEGNDTLLMDTLRFVLERKMTTTDFTVRFTSIDSTARGGSYINRDGDTDFIPIGDTLRFTAAGGNLSDTIKVPVLQDRKTELDEYLKVSLVTITNTTDQIFVADSLGIGTIINNDTSYLSVLDTFLIEGNGAVDSLCFIINMDGELDTSFNFDFLTFDSTATVIGGDYLTQSGMGTGSGTGVGYTFLGIDTIKIGILNDFKTELDEHFKLTLENINAYGRALLFQDSVAVGTIINDDTTTISIADATIIEGNTGVDSLEFVITLDKMIDTLGISYLTLDSTALVGDLDYVQQADTIYMNCVLNDTIKIAINGDSKVELTEYFKVELREIFSTNRPVSFNDSLAIGTIIDNDTARIIIDDVILDEGDTSQTSFIFAITLDNDLDRSITIDYATYDSTATLADGDYVTNTGILNFAGVANEKDTIMINVIGDGIVEVDEVFSVKISNIAASGLAAFFTDSIGLGHILNDDFDPTIIDPCECLNNASSPSVKDGQFSETARVSSQSGENWYIVANSGLYQAPAGIFPPAKNGSPYPLNNYTTGPSGYKLTEIDLGNGLSRYLINGLHIDGIGYEITITNGVDTLSIGNLCHYETACSANQTIVMPFYPGVSGEAKIDNCDAINKFINDGIHLYRDDAPRYNEMTICPNLTGQILTVSFQALDLAVGDTLWVYEGKDTSTAKLIAKGSGNSPSQINGAWVTSNCDPNINPSGCLTFVFTTNGDNNKGAGWEALVNCELQGVTTLNVPDDVFAAVKCDSLKTNVNLRAPTINRSSSDCLLINDSIIVSYCGIKDTLKAGALSHPIFPFGTYDVQYQLLADTTITTANRVHVSVPPLTCNDTVITTIGQGCFTMLQPDDILENACDTIGGPISQQYSIRIRTDSGYVQGTSPNYPILDAGKNGNITCNRFYEVAIFRLLRANNNGCMQTAIDSCTGVVKFVDGIKPVFVGIETDTIFGCYDMSVTQSMLNEPNVIDNCEIDKLVATIPKPSGGNCELTKQIEVVWTAYDLCGNSSTATQSIIIQRPDKVEIPKDTILDCGSNTLPEFTGWPKIDIDGDGIVDQDITTSDAYCNFELIFEDQTIPGTCGNNFNILRIFTLYDDCKNISNQIFIDTQYIVLKDTIAPEIFCPSAGTIGSQSNPYIFNTNYNSCTGLPGDIKLPTGSDNCDDAMVAFETGIYRVSDNQLMAKSLAFLNSLEVGTYRVAYVLRDDCGNTSEVCNIYFNIIDQTIPTAICSDRLIVSLTYGELEISANDISNGSFDVCGLDTILIRRTICGSTTEYSEEINPFVAAKFGSNIGANGWSSHIQIGCCDINTTIKVQLLIFDKGGNHNKCWLTISPENQPQSVCGDLPDAGGYCDDYATNNIGESTDANGNRAFDAEEWQPINENLLNIINTQFGSPACNASNTTCINNSIEQEYQLIKDFCGVQTMRRRFRTKSFDSATYPWYYQNITINYRPGWSITFPADSILQCGTIDANNIPEMELNINEGTCDQIGWEVKDEIFELEDGACFKILRHWYIINACQHGNLLTPFELPRDQVNGLVLPGAKRTFTSDDLIAGAILGEKGYFSYTQIIKVLDTEAPIITIADVDTCITGVTDVAPFYQADNTPGTAPYECDTLRLFSATGMDCVPSNQLHFRYEVFDEGVRVSFGNGDYFYHVVQPNRTYTIRFTASDNCGNIGSAERTFTFSDCRRPSALCESISLNLNASQGTIITAQSINSNSYDNCTDSSNLDLRIWHPSLGISAPSNLSEVLVLPIAINLNCQTLRTTTATLYVIDEAQNYSSCNADITLTDNLNLCQDVTRPQITGRIQSLQGDMVEEVAILLSGPGEMPEMITTDNSGVFNYQVAAGADYLVQPSKNINPLNGVSTFDLVLIQKHILGLQTFESPYNYIAADVNQSGAVSAYDMVVLRQLILNIRTEFPNNESWKFVNMEYPMNAPNPLIDGYQQSHSIANISSNVNVDFMAVKVGDINGNAKPNSLLTAEDRNIEDTLHFYMKNQKVEKGQSYVVDFVTKNLSEIEGYQFTLQFDGLNFEGWQGGLVDENYFGFAFVEKGMITTSWNQDGNTKFPAKAVAFQLRFTAHKEGFLNNMLSINSAFTEAEGYMRDGALTAVNLVFEEPKIQNNSFELYQNRPNPFKQYTQIGFYLPQASATTLRIIDMTGQVIKTQKGNYEKGEHIIVLNRRDLPATGLVYYQLETSAGKMTKTMLVFD